MLGFTISSHETVVVGLTDSVCAQDIFYPKGIIYIIIFCEVVHFSSEYYDELMQLKAFFLSKQSLSHKQVNLLPFFRFASLQHRPLNHKARREKSQDDAF